MTACGPVMVKRLNIDNSLLECPDAPAVPAKHVTNRQDAQYKNDLKYAHEDCHSKLARVREVQEQANVRKGWFF